MKESKQRERDRVEALVGHTGVRVMRLVDQFSDELRSSSVEARWMAVAAMQAYFTAWGQGCNDQEWYQDMVKMWEGCTEVEKL